MSQSVTPSSFFYDLFTPLPESGVKRDSDALDHLADYVDTSEGTWDFFRVVTQVCETIEHFASSVGLREGVAKVKEVFGLAGMGLSVPRAISDANTLKGSVTALVSAQNLPESDPLKTRKIAQAAKKTFIDTLGLTSTVTQMALFAESAKLFVLETLPLRVVQGVNTVAGGVFDAFELVGECFKLKHYASPEAAPRTPGESAKLAEKKTLAWITIAKDVASVAAGVIALTAIVFGVTISHFPVVATAALGLGALWLAMKLTAYFYNKVVVEASVA